MNKSEAEKQRFEIRIKDIPGGSVLYIHDNRHDCEYPIESIVRILNGQVVVHSSDTSGASPDKDIENPITKPTNIEKLLIDLFLVRADLAKEHMEEMLGRYEPFSSGNPSKREEYSRLIGGPEIRG